MSNAAERPTDKSLLVFDEVSVHGNAADGTRFVRLAPVSATVRKRRLTAITGPSGSGKSTLLRCCNRLIVPTSGSIEFLGTDLSEIEPLALRRRVGMLFQRPTTFAGSVADNLRVAEPAATDARIVELLERARLSPDYADRVADSLSGGEAQRMCLARALATRPEVLLMDEPTSALDETNRDGIEATTLDLLSDGVSVIWVSHDAHQVERLAHDVVEVR